MNDSSNKILNLSTVEDTFQESWSDGYIDKYTKTVYYPKDNMITLTWRHYEKWPKTFHFSDSDAKEYFSQDNQNRKRWLNQKIKSGSLKKITEEQFVTEKLSASQSASVWIRDFIDSTNPKFEGKTKKERIAMALGAYYAAQKNEEYGAGFEGTDELRKKYIKDTPGQRIQQFKTTMNQQTYKTYQEFATQHKKMYPTHTSDQVRAAWETYSKAFEMEEAKSFVSKGIYTLDGKKIEGSRSSKLFLQALDTDGFLHDLSWKEWSESNLTDASSDSIKKQFVDRLAKQIKMFNKRIDLNTWLKGGNRSFVDTINYIFKLDPNIKYSKASGLKEDTVQENTRGISEPKVPSKGSYDLKEEKESYDSWIIKPREGKGEQVKVNAPDETSAIEIALGRKPSQNEIDFFNFHYILIHEKTNVSTLRNMKIVELATNCYDSDLVKEFVEQQYKPQTSALQIKESFRSFVSKQAI